MCQNLYMPEASPWAYDPRLAESIKPVVRELVLAALVTAEALYDR